MYNGLREELEVLQYKEMKNVIKPKEKDTHEARYTLLC